MSWSLTYSGGDGSKTDGEVIKPKKRKILKVVDEKSKKKESEITTTGI
jgi:hypothetical protein